MAPVTQTCSIAVIPTILFYTKIKLRYLHNQEQSWAGEKNIQIATSCTYLRHKYQSSAIAQFII